MKADKSASETANIQAPRGTYDILPGESEQWQLLETRFRPVLQNAGYREIRLPIFEHTELFKRGVGETTDIVNKEMYTFDDRSDRSLTLRPEGTAGVVRAYLEHGFKRQSPPVKLWYCGPMFRYERTQTGRQRQFHQTGIEAFGSAGPAIDAEVISLACDCMYDVGIQNFKVHLNSIGCKVCRPAYRELLKETLRPLLPNLCADCQDRFERNPLRMLDCKNADCQKHYQNLPSPLEHLCQECDEHWKGLLTCLKACNIEPVINKRLVRGLDYYCRTVFELITDDARLGAQATICAGGRYDYLVETLGGDPTPGVGWALGMERVRMLLGKSEAVQSEVFVVADKGEVGLELATRIRRAGFSCELDFPAEGMTPRKIQKQMERATKNCSHFAVICGEDERQRNSVAVKNLNTRRQVLIPEELLVHFLRYQKGFPDGEALEEIKQAIAEFDSVE